MKSPAKKVLRIAQVGFGVVGKACATSIIRDRQIILERCGIDIEIKTIVKRDISQAGRDGLALELFTTNFEDVVNDPEIDVVVELIGGCDAALQIVSSALRHKKHVVTANKALLAIHGDELFALARANGVALSFEASCGGGIPIVRALLDGLLANSLDAIYGIVNGTSNYILTEMIEHGTAYQTALTQAQELGLAEPDPTFDVEGIDSAHKISILSTLAFGLSIPFSAISIKGITSLESADVSAGSEMGYVIKLIAMAVKTANGISVRVEPAFIDEKHPLAWVSGSFNAVSVYGHQVGHTLYYGRGAGGAPTSSALVADIISIGLGIPQIQFANLPVLREPWPKAKLIEPGQLERRYYIRLMVHEKPGVLAFITQELAKNHISVSSIVQKEQETSNGIIPLVITTHSVMEYQVSAALAVISEHPLVSEHSVVLPIIAEHDEFTPHLSHRRA